MVFLKYFVGLIISSRWYNLLSASVVMIISFLWVFPQYDSYSAFRGKGLYMDVLMSKLRTKHKQISNWEKNHRRYSIHILHTIASRCLVCAITRGFYFIIAVLKNHLHHPINGLNFFIIAWIWHDSNSYVPWDLATIIKVAIKYARIWSCDQKQCRIIVYANNKCVHIEQEIIG